MRVQLIAKQTPGMTGVWRYTQDLHQGLKAAGLDAQIIFPSKPPIPSFLQWGLKQTGLDVRSFFGNYPLQVKLEQADVYHLTGQMLATLLLFQHFPKPVVVSVLDIIPYLVRKDPELNTFRHPVDYLFYRLALIGLRRADALIAISNYTKQTLVEALHLPEDRIQVIYPIVDLHKFYPKPVSEAFRTKYCLDKKFRYILFVGSEDPRKNLCTLVRAFAALKQQAPDVKLLKVGSSQFLQERMKLQSLIAALNLQQDILFYENVPDDDLPDFYNAADVVVMPSLYEGFGLPTVEAMACGTPVISAQTGSLAEIVDGSGILVQPQDDHAWTFALYNLLMNPEEQYRLSQSGRERAARFNSENAMCEMQKIYMQVIERKINGKTRSLRNRTG